MLSATYKAADSPAHKGGPQTAPHTPSTEAMVEWRVKVSARVPVSLSTVTAVFSSSRRVLKPSWAHSIPSVEPLSPYSHSSSVMLNVDKSIVLLTFHSDGG